MITTNLLHFVQLISSSANHKGKPSRLSSFPDPFPSVVIYTCALVMQETERLVNDPAPGITAVPHDDNLRYFNVTIQGPGGSPFEGGDIHIRALLSC